MNTKKDAHNRLVNAIVTKINQGYVLDASKMKGTCIEQLNGDWDSIDDEYLPCLVKTPEDEVGIDFFEKEDPIPLDKQVGLQSQYPIELEVITDECLQDILQAMVKP